MRKTKPSRYELERQSNAEPMPITVRTRVPSKWRFCDLETNQVYEWNPPANNFVLSELPLTFPNFGDKTNIMAKAKDFTAEAQRFFDAYDKVFKYDHSKPVDIIQLGAEVTKALDTFFSALVMWKIELESWHRGSKVEQLISERTDKESDDADTTTTPS